MEAHSLHVLVIYNGSWMRRFSVWLERYWKGMCHIRGIVQNITCQPSIRCAPALIRHNVWVTSNCCLPEKQGFNGWVGPQCLAVWFVQTRLAHVFLFLNGGSHLSVLLCSTWQTSVTLKTFKGNRNSPVLDFWHLLSYFLLSLSVSSSNFYSAYVGEGKVRTPLLRIVCLPEECSYSVAEMETILLWCAVPGTARDTFRRGREGGAILGHKLCCCEVLTAGGHWERLLKNRKTEGFLEIGGLGSWETARPVIV